MFTCLFGRSTPAIRAILYSLTLSLLMLGISADNAHNTKAFNHFTFVADRFYACSYLHKNPLKKIALLKPNSSKSQ